MPDSFYGAMLDTIGLEYESTSLRKEDVQEHFARMLPKLLGGDYKKIVVTRDASIEFHAENVAMGSMGSHRRLLSIHSPDFSALQNQRLGDTRTMGFEIFTSPLEVPLFEKIVNNLLAILTPMGDFTSNRASVHFHVGFANNLRFLKNMLTIGLHMEPIFYRLGGMGGYFRGFSNACAYSRPLLNSAAVFIKHPPRKPDEISDEERSLMEIAAMSPQNTEDLAKISRARDKLATIRERLGIKPQWYRVINPVAALEARDLERFWASFGVEYEGAIKKYHPSRYTALNFYSVAQHGTIEFRYCNQTLDSDLIIAVGKLFRITADLATTLSKRELQKFPARDSNLEVSMRDADDSIHMLLEMAREKELEDLPNYEEVNLIMETIEASHFAGLPENTVKTHKPDFVINPDVVLLGNLQVAENPMETCHVEIHNIGNDVSLYDKGDKIYVSD